MAENSKPAAKTQLTGVVPADCAAVLVYTTFPDEAAALSLGRVLVEQQLAGCVNLLPGMVSLYVWNGALERANECVLIAKTTPERSQDCMQAILAAHPYDTPAVLALPVAAGAADYLDWIRRGTSPVPGT